MATRLREERDPAVWKESSKGRRLEEKGMALSGEKKCRRPVEMTVPRLADHGAIGKANPHRGKGTKRTFGGRRVPAYLDGKHFLGNQSKRDPSGKGVLHIF